MHEPRTSLGTSRRQSLYGASVHGERLVLLALAYLHIVECGAVENEVRAELGDDGLDRAVVGYVELGVGRSEHLRTALEQLFEVRRELAAATRDQYPPRAHRAARNWSICGVTSWSSSSQRML